MKVETRLNKILMIEDKDRRKHKLFEFIMKVMPQSIIQKKAIEEYNKIWKDWTQWQRGRKRTILKNG